MRIFQLGAIILLATSITGCATPVSVKCPTLPEPPAELMKEPRQIHLIPPALRLTDQQTPLMLQSLDSPFGLQQLGIEPLQLPPPPVHPLLTGGPLPGLFLQLPVQGQQLLRGLAQTQLLLFQPLEFRPPQGPFCLHFPQPPQKPSNAAFVDHWPLPDF